jgi:hypothetical protein
MLLLRNYVTARLVLRLDAGWTAEGSEFESGWGQDCSLLYLVQTCTGAQPVSYSVGTGPTNAEFKYMRIYRRSFVNKPHSKIIGVFLILQHFRLQICETTEFGLALIYGMT